MALVRPGECLPIFAHTPAVLRSAARPLLALAVATLLGGMGLFAPPIVRAAPAVLQVVTQTRYSALPAEKRIHVSVDARATNLTPDPANGRYYYSAARFAVQPAIRNLAAVAKGVPLAARVLATSAEFTTVEIAFGRSLLHGASFGFRFAFDILDPGGAPQRDVRVASSLMAFPVWAFGSRGTPGSSVSVVLPAGYTVAVGTGMLASARGADGTTLLSATSIPDPDAFFAYVTAERPGAFHETPVKVQLPEGAVTVQVRAWDDDPDWGARIKELVSDGLPMLRSLIGLSYQIHGELRIEEAAGARLGDYAGVYNNVTEMIDVRYDTDGFTALHETAHTWFNDTLLTGRWIAEAWAEYYGVEAGRRIGADGQIFTVTAQLQTAKIPLNAWGAIGEEPPLTEDFGYAASYHLAQLIAARSGVAGLQQVWRAAKESEASYQPSHPGSAPEKGLAATVDGWQRLLDLLEERTHRSYSDLWRQWVVTDAQARVLDERATTRSDYAKTVTAAGGWELPYQVRYTLGAWQFSIVNSELVDARSVLADRDRIEAEAARLSLRVPTALKNDFESGTTFDPAKQDAASELKALSALGSATSALGQQPTPLQWVGLLLANPGQHLSAARIAFEKGDADSAARDAQVASAERGAAADAGRLRVGLAGGAGLFLDGLFMGALALGRHRRRARAMGLSSAGAEVDPLA